MSLDKFWHGGSFIKLNLKKKKKGTLSGSTENNVLSKLTKPSRFEII